MKYRIEKDTMGEVKVPHTALWGAQTQRALENFKISGIKFAFPFGRSFIEALGVIKYAAAASNQKLKLLDGRKAKAIKIASKEVLSGNHDNQFPLDVFQTGSGTSTNMNANEVIANLATKKARIKINPNDHVNMSQSSNDVIPTAICISVLLDTHRLLLPSLGSLIKVIDKKDSTSEKWQVDGHPMSIAFISSISKPFCTNCNRGRLSADGKFYTCLFSDTGYDFSRYLRNNDFVNEFSQLQEDNNEFLSPGRKRLLSNIDKKEVNWDFNQDIETNENENFSIKGSRVFHQKYGYGVLVDYDGEKANVKFEKSDLKNIFIKYLQFKY